MLDGGERLVEGAGAFVRADRIRGDIEVAASCFTLDGADTEDEGIPVVDPGFKTGEDADLGDRLFRIGVGPAHGVEGGKLAVLVAKGHGNVLAGPEHRGDDMETVPFADRLAPAHGDGEGGSIGVMDLVFEKHRRGRGHHQGRFRHRIGEPEIIDSLAGHEGMKKGEFRVAWKTDNGRAVQGKGRCFQLPNARRKGVRVEALPPLVPWLERPCIFQRKRLSREG